MEVLLSTAIPGSTSILAIPTLPSIPDSRMPTPSHTPPEDDLAAQQGLLPLGPPVATPPRGGRSRSGSASSLILMPGSYFNAPHGSAAFPISASSTVQASGSAERPKPEPLTIPPHTPDEPLFSAYPDAGPSRSSSLHKPKAFSNALLRPFTLATPPRRRRHASEDSSADEEGFVTDPSVGRKKQSAALQNFSDSEKRGRRRASTVTHPNRTPSRPGPSPQASGKEPGRSLRSFRRRRASLGASPLPQQLASPDFAPNWPAMPAQEKRRFDTSPTMAFGYQHPGASDYTIQSVSTVATVRPLSSTPNIAARKSSISAISPSGESRSAIGLVNLVPHPTDPDVDLVIPDDLAMPRGPPPRRSSLDATVMSLSGEGPPLPLNAENIAVLGLSDDQSLLSSSMTNTETSLSADALFSPQASDDKHPLSSATTSLSRSAKSGSEGKDEAEAAISAIRLQRSLEWEARQNRHWNKMQKRKMIVLELVETEVAYAEDLKRLVDIYLPHLAALPAVSERTVDMIVRNAPYLLELHSALAKRMVQVLKEEGLTYEHQPEPLVAGKIERAARRLSALFLEETSAFAAYNEYCAGSIAAATLVRRLAERSDYENYERCCQRAVFQQHTHMTLQDLLSDSPPSDSSPNRARLRFRDFLITPVQRVCRYPLLLAQLIGAAPSPAVEHTSFEDSEEVGRPVSQALSLMRNVAEEADEARRLKEAEVKSATIVERIEPHLSLSYSFLRSLGTCRLIGSLDVLHYHPTLAPLVPPVKVKYMAAFLYRGYLILAKVKKDKVYEVKHHFPLEVFELVDITEGFLPHSVRLSVREHNYDLAASCEAEKQVWAAALCAAREDNIVPPFELPSSVSLFAPRSRRMSVTVPPTDFEPSSPSSKRHTLAGLPSELSLTDIAREPEQIFQTPMSSPTRMTFKSTPDRGERSGRQSILIRRPSHGQRIHVDRGLMDVFSESCATARSKAQLSHTLFLPDVPPSELRDRLSIRESTMLRRRRSFLDSRQPSFDIAFSGEIRGSILPVRQARSQVGHRKASPPRTHSHGSSDSNDADGRASADEAGTSDFGTLRGSMNGNVWATSSSQMSRSNSVTSFSPAPTPRRSVTSLRTAYANAGAGLMNRRKTASTYNLPRRAAGNIHRAKSTPNSPRLSPQDEAPPIPRPPPLFKTHSDSSTVVPARSSDSDSPVHPNGPSFASHQPPSSESQPSSSTWETIRRSMSFKIGSSRNRASAADISAQIEEGSAPTTSSSHGFSSWGSVPGPKSSENSVVDLSDESTPPQSGSSLERGTSDKSIRSDRSEKSEDEDGGVFTTLRKKRTPKLFGLSRLTPM